MKISQETHFFLEINIKIQDGGYHRSEAEKGAAQPSERNRSTNTQPLSSFGIKTSTILWHTNEDYLIPVISVTTALFLLKMATVRCLSLLKKKILGCTLK